VSVTIRITGDGSLHVTVSPDAPSLEVTQRLQRIESGVDALLRFAAESASREVALTEAANRMNASLDRLNTASNTIASALRDALAVLKRDDATAEEEEAAIARIDGVSAFLEQAVGTNPNNPVPDVPPVLTDPLVAA